MLHSYIMVCYVLWAWTRGCVVPYHHAHHIQMLKTQPSGYRRGYLFYTNPRPLSQSAKKKINIFFFFTVCFNVTWDSSGKWGPWHMGIWGSNNNRKVTVAFSPKQATAASPCLKQSLTSQVRGASLIWRRAGDTGAEKHPGKQAWFTSPSESLQDHRISAHSSKTLHRTTVSLGLHFSMKSLVSYETY